MAGLVGVLVTEVLGVLGAGDSGDETEGCACFLETSASYFWRFSPHLLAASAVFICRSPTRSMPVEVPSLGSGKREVGELLGVVETRVGIN